MNRPAQRRSLVVVALLLVAAGAVVWWRGAVRPGPNAVAARPAASPTLAATAANRTSAPAPSAPVVKPRVPAPPVSEPATPADLRNAFLEALKLRQPVTRDREVARTLRLWLEADFDAALAHVSAMPAGPLQAVTAPEVARAMARRNPADALDWIKRLGDPHVRQQALLNVIEVWAQKDPAAAGKYVAAMEPGPTQMSAAAEAARSMAAANPADAIKWAQSLSNPSAGEFALISIAGTWAQREPAAAAKWASELPANETRTEALKGALTYWFVNDDVAALKFVAALPVDLQPRAAACIAPMLTQDNPRAAVEWARTLAHPESRDAALLAVMTRWRELAPKEADAWLRTANLPATTKAKLQSAR